MATNVGEIYIGLTFDTSSAEGGLKNLEKQAEKTTGSTEATFSKWTVAVGNIIASAFVKIGEMIAQTLDYGIKRADILNRYPIAIQNMGGSADEASEALNKLSNYTLGLSTHLDDAVASTQRLAGQLEDVGRAERVFEALNDLALAGAASNAIQATAVEQWTQAISRGRFDIQKEFNAMVVANSRAVKELARQLLGASANTDDLYQALQKGVITMDEFLNALIDLDQNGTESMTALSQAARDADKGIETAFERFNTKLGKIWTEIINTVGWENIIDIIDTAGDMFTFLGQQVSGILDGFYRFGVWLREGNEGLDRLNYTTKLVTVTANEYQDALDKATEAASSLDDAQNRLVESQNKLVSIQREVAAINGDVASAYLNMQEKTEAATRAARAQNMEYEDAVRWAKEYRGDMTDLSTSQLELIKSVSSAINAENSYNSALEKRSELDQNIITQQTVIENANKNLTESQYQMAYAQQFAMASSMLAFGEYERLSDYLDSLSRSTGTYSDTFGNTVEMTVEDSHRMAQEIGDALYGLDHNWALIWRNMELNADGAGKHVEGTARNMLAGVGNALSPGNFNTIAHQAMEGFKNGINAKAQEVSNAVAQIGTRVLGAFRSALDIHSPSRVMFEQGAYVVEGLVDGIRSQEESLRTAVSDLASDVSSTLNYSTPTVHADVGFSDENVLARGGVSVVMNNYINSEMDAEQIDQKLLTAIRRATA